jgi:hypothetical protein
MELKPLIEDAFKPLPVQAVVKARGFRKREGRQDWEILRRSNHAAVHAHEEIAAQSSTSYAPVQSRHVLQSLYRKALLVANQNFRLKVSEPIKQRKVPVGEIKWPRRIIQYPAFCDGPRFDRSQLSLTSVMVP